MKDVFPYLYIWISACCGTTITLTPASSTTILIWLHIEVCRSLFLVDQEKKFSGPPWQCRQPLTCAKKHQPNCENSLLRLESKHIFVWGCLFSTQILVSSSLVGAWDLRLAVLGWVANAGVGKLSPAWWSTGGCWRLQQPPSPPPLPTTETFALQATFAIINAPGDRKSPSCLLWLRLVASDVLGPAAEAHTAELTLFSSHTHTYVDTL